jgi:hypothetical protein
MARTQEEIIKDLRDVECRLSPENLHCDGEISRAQANQKCIKLEKQQRELLKELGRKPTDAELWNNG